MGPTAWDHNAWYHRTLLDQVPPGSRRVLEVGCGAGALARRLAARAGEVEAIDADPVMVALARRRVPQDVIVRHADVLDVDLPAGGYDAVVSSSVLHHLPLGPALTRMAGWLRPGGVLAAVSHPRIDLPRELPLEVAAVLAHQGLGAAFVLGRRVTGRPLFGWEPTVADMPVRDPVLTTREVRAGAAAVLPGVRVCRLLFWRFALTWTKPLTQRG